MTDPHQYAEWATVIELIVRSFAEIVIAIGVALLARR